MKHVFTLFALCCCVAVTAQSVEVSPENIDFGNVVYGQKDSVLVTLQNLTDDELSIDELRFFDVYLTRPYYVNQAPSAIPSLGAVGFYVVYEPVHNIDHNSELVIRPSGGRGAVSVDLVGSCTYPISYYSTTFDLKDEALEAELKSITGAGYTQYGYSEARDEMFLEIDNQKVNGQGASQNTLTRRYIGTNAVGYTSRGDLFNNYDVNTEHTFPQGFFDSNLPMKSDLHHLYPTDVNANSVRGSLRFGEVVTAIDWEEGGSKRGNDDTGAQVFEPRDQQKGVAARADLYFVTRYQNYGGHVSELMEETLRAWNDEFPPTDVERNRNDDIADYQNNRNPFVDYPQFAKRIFSFRLEENRPNVGELVLSDETMDFGQVDGGGGLPTFNLVLTNIGERFILLDGFTLDGASVFALSGDMPSVVNPGESVSVKVSVDAETLIGVQTAVLNFNASNVPMSIDVTAEGVSGLKDLRAAGFSLAPNPAKGSVRLLGELSAVRSLALYDAVGRKCLQVDPRVGQLDLTGLAPGVYTVVLTLRSGHRYTELLSVK